MITENMNKKYQNQKNDIQGAITAQQNSFLFDNKPRVIEPHQPKVSLDSIDNETTFVSIKNPRSQREHRALAFQLLYALDSSDYALSSDDLLFELTNIFKLNLPEECFVKKLVAGAVLHREEFNQILKDVLLNWDYNRLSTVVRLTLYLALWEMNHYKETPQKTVIDEYIEIAKKFGEADSFRIVNGVLDKIIKH